MLAKTPNLDRSGISGCRLNRMIGYIGVNHNFLSCEAVKSRLGTLCFARSFLFFHSLINFTFTCFLPLIEVCNFDCRLWFGLNYTLSQHYDLKLPKMFWGL